MKKYLIALALLAASFFTSENVQAQADINMSTHWYNRGNYNPAFIARPEFLYIFSNMRYQWTTVEGAPRVFNLQASQYFHSMKSAIGVSFIADKIGATQVYNPMLNYAYRIKSNSDFAISMGISGGFFQRSINGNLFEADALNDPAIQYNNEKNIQPDANIGLELHNRHFILGLSSTHILSMPEQGNTFSNANHRYGYLIYKNNNSEEFYYKVGLHVANRDNLTVYEANIMLRLKHSTGLMNGPKEIFDFGFSLRSSRQISFMTGILLSPDLRIGYAYDHSFINGYYTNGTHEIMLEYRIPNKLASTRRCGT